MNAYQTNMIHTGQQSTNYGLKQFKGIRNCISFTIVWEIKNNQKLSKKWRVSLIEKLFEKIKYGSCTQNNDFDNITIEYQQSLFT